MVLVWGLALIAQIAAPPAAFLLLWPALAGGLAAASVARFAPDLTRPLGAALIAVVGAVVGGWVLAMAHPVFLGIGMDLPSVLAVLGLLALTLLRPLPTPRARLMAGLAAAVLIAGAAVSFAGTQARPAQPEAAQVG